MPQSADEAPKRSGGPREAGTGDEAELEEERRRTEADELASFERRAEWWRLHYGGSDEEVAERLREATEHAERMPQADDEPEKTN